MSGLDDLQRLRRETAAELAKIDAAIAAWKEASRGGKGKSREPLSEATKHKISEAAKARKAQHD
jgi:hypothetical protein